MHGCSCRAAENATGTRNEPSVGGRCPTRHAQGQCERGDPALSLLGCTSAPKQAACALLSDGIDPMASVPRELQLRPPPCVLAAQGPPESHQVGPVELMLWLLLQLLVPCWVLLRHLTCPLHCPPTQLARKLPYSMLIYFYFKGRLTTAASTHLLGSLPRCTPGPELGQA